MKKNFKGRCEKRKLPKCEGVCKTYNSIQYAYADVLSSSNEIKSFQVKKHLPQYTVLEIKQKSEYPDDGYLFMVSAIKDDSSFSM